MSNERLKRLRPITVQNSASYPNKEKYRKLTSISLILMHHGNVDPMSDIMDSSVGLLRRDSLFIDIRMNRLLV